MSSSNDNLLKSNFIIGSSQIVQMLSTIARAKIIALLLGSTGIALNAVFQSLLQMINNIASLGIMQSGVREISQANSENSARLSKTIGMFTKVVSVLGTGGLLICVFFSYPIGLLSFGRADQIISIAFLGFGVLFCVKMHGEMTILQGTRRVLYLAKSSIFGSLLSLIICIPCYYFFGNTGVVISIILSYFIFWVSYRFFRNKIGLKTILVPVKQAFKESTPLISLGVVLMIGTFFVSLFAYLTNITIRALGNLTDVGLYQGVASIATQSIVVVVAVLASDFFPRVSALVGNINERNELINQQLNVVICLIPPIVVLIICFSKLIIKLLLTDEFIVVAPLLQYLSMSLLFRGIWITMSYVILAQGDRSRYLLFDAIIGNGITYLVNVIAYKVCGLNGLGFSSLFSAIIVAYTLFMVCKIQYGIIIHKSTWMTLFVLILLIATTFVVYEINIICSVVIGLVTISFSLYNLLSWYGIVKLIKSRKNGLHKH